MIELTSSPFPEVGGGVESSNSKYRVVSEKEMIPKGKVYHCGWLWETFFIVQKCIES